MSQSKHSKHSLPDDDQLVSCEICLKSVPLSEADVAEAEDYVVYFCGLDCYAEWRNRIKKDQTKDH